MTRLIRYSTDLYSNLEAETGLSTGWKQCGSLAVARTADRMIQLKRTAAVAQRVRRRLRRDRRRPRRARCIR